MLAAIAIRFVQIFFVLLLIGCGYAMGCERHDNSVVRGAWTLAAIGFLALCGLEAALR